MEVTKEMREEAKTIAKTHRAKEVFANDKGEYFTEHHFARNSVGGDESRFAQVWPKQAEAPAATTAQTDVAPNKKKGGKKQPVTTPANPVLPVSAVEPPKTTEAPAAPAPLEENTDTKPTE